MWRSRFSSLSLSLRSKIFHLTPFQSRLQALRQAFWEALRESLIEAVLKIANSTKRGFGVLGFWCFGDLVLWCLVVWDLGSTDNVKTTLVAHVQVRETWIEDFTRKSMCVYVCFHE